MKMNPNSVFSDYYNTGIMDKNFKVIYADSSRMVRLLSKGGKRLVEKMRKTKDVNVFKHIFRFQGKIFEATIHRLENETYVCRIAGEIPDEELEIDELFDYVDEIKFSTLNIHSMIKMIEEYANKSKYLNDDFHNSIKDIKAECGNAYTRCYNILHAFENNYELKYIPLNRYLLRTLDVMQFVTRRMNNRLCMDLDLIYPYVKIDYSKFELAFYNLAKVIMIYSLSESNPVISVKGIDENVIEIKAEFKYYNNMPIDKCDLEIRAIKYIFRKLGGHFELSASEGKMNAYGIIKVESSWDKDDVEPGYDIRYIGTDDIIRQREEMGRYIRIYENFTEDNILKFASTVSDLSDIGNSDTFMAEMFFSQCLNEWFSLNFA